MKRTMFVILLVASVLFAANMQFAEATMPNAQSLVENNQFIGIVESSDADRVVSIGGGYPMTTDPELYSETGFAGTEFHYAVVFLRDSHFKTLDEVDLRDVVVAGDTVKAWYVNPATVSGTPVSPSGQPANYWNPVTGLVVTVTAGD